MITSYAKLTPRQHEAIGRVASNWTVVEFYLEQLTVRLAHAPSFPGLALSNDLSINNRLKALRNLVDMNVRRYHSGRDEENLIATLQETLLGYAREIATKKDSRNTYVHAIWLRITDDEMFPARIRGKQAPSAHNHPKEKMPTVQEVMRFADEIEDLAERMAVTLETLPDIEEQPRRFFVLDRRRPHPDT